ncbi:hypothetical protein [Paraburkholderia acidisoli]|uniref:Lipoprotein n=1 Tax=Paraburkholderia acidisoli TaxID=2571748 RepID=A0A7Z2GPN9_9BURK|nr:hypothetical protein [Paraburkholderia acidisoli]QGZ65640.1 hypothetical protein FAZ98_28280 [Paraburkholderia acidisoli]
MKAIQGVTLLLAVLVLISCTRGSGVFSLSPVFSTFAPVRASEVGRCIKANWKLSARDFRVVASGGTIRISAVSYFKGVPVGARLQRRSNGTSIEYFERRAAPARYLSDVQRCIRSSMTASAGPGNAPAERAADD